MRIDEIHRHEPWLSLLLQFAGLGPQPRNSGLCRKVIIPVAADRAINQITKAHEVIESIRFDDVAVFEQWRVDRHVCRVESAAEVPLPLIGSVIAEFMQTMP